MRRRPEPLPFEAGITDLAQDGRGVARREGKTVFVDDALPGERVRASIVRRRRSHDEARLDEVLTASPDRVEPRCPHFGNCGGCSLQHLAPAAQLSAKESSLFEALERIGGVTPDTRFAPLSGPAWAYRRRARLGVRLVEKKGRVLVGFRERHTSWLADMDSCEVLAGGVGRMLMPLSELIGGLSVARRIPQVEVAVGEDRTAMVFRVLDPLTPEDAVRLARFGADQGVEVWLQTGGPDTVRPLEGEPAPLHYRLPGFDVDIAFLPTDFVQVNAAMNQAAVARAVELLDGEGQRVLDLFSGLGNFSLALARRGAAITGVEGEARLVDRARGNAQRNGLEVDYHVANLFEDFSGLPWARAGCDRLLLDPPRAGAQAVAESVDVLGPQRVVYVSCHPGTLARDAGILGGHGYRCTGAGVMDMFPHTTHVESIAVFDRS
ncbi:MAG: 23S rRNA (uracil(1939)-C(5))-methyltransferase RlmD [Gammaproteobacteria bacterium]